MIETLSDLKERFRRDVSDIQEGIPTDPDSENLWSDEDILWYANSAIDMVLRRTASEVKTFTVVVVAGQPEVRLPPAFRVLHMKRVALDSRRLDLEERGVDGVVSRDDYFNTLVTTIDWETVQTGVPQFYTLDRKTNKMYLFPVPAANDLLVITAVVTSVTNKVYFDFEDFLPFDELVDIHLVLMWMKKLAYEKQDADAMDLERAAQFEREFEDRVVSRKYERYRQRRPVSLTTFSW